MNNVCFEVKKYVEYEFSSNLETQISKIFSSVPDKLLERLMYNRLYNFLEVNSIIYDLQFSFRQKNSTSHALIHLTDKTREQLDSGDFTC